MHYTVVAKFLKEMYADEQGQETYEKAFGITQLDEYYFTVDHYRIYDLPHGKKVYRVYGENQTGDPVEKAQYEVEEAHNRLITPEEKAIAIDGESLYTNCGHRR